MSIRQRIRLTREWAERFRTEYETTTIAEPGVDPIIHEAMRQSLLAQADELDAEANHLAWQLVRPWVILVGSMLVAAAVIAAGVL